MYAVSGMSVDPVRTSCTRTIMWRRRSAGASPRAPASTPRASAPYDLITRAQAITMVVRGVDHLRVGRLEDPPVGYTASFGRFSPVHDSAAAKAEYNGLLDDLVGMESGSQMWDSVTRGEVAAVLAPLLDL